MRLALHRRRHSHGWYSQIEEKDEDAYILFAIDLSGKRFPHGLVEQVLAHQTVAEAKRVQSGDIFPRWGTHAVTTAGSGREYAKSGMKNRDWAWPSQEGRVHLRRPPRPYHRSAVPVIASTGQPHHSAASE